MDTYNDDDMSDYGDSDGGNKRGFGDLADEDKLSVNLDDIADDDDDDAIDLSAPPQKSQMPSAANQADIEETKDENNTSGSDD